MTEKPTYVLGINAYDHDASACLLRDGEIAFAIIKERITREKHDTGFYEDVVNYCLDAEGITLSDVDVIVRNSYILPVEDMEERLLYQYNPDYLNDEERELALKNTIFQSKSDKVVTISHHMAHAYSAFAPSPHEDGVVMIVDGVGSYNCDVTEAGHDASQTSAFSRESESYYTFSGTKLEPVKKVWLEPTRGFLSDEFFIMDGLGAMYSRVSMYIFGDWNKCGEVMGLAPYGRPERFKPLLTIENNELHAPAWTSEFGQPYINDGEESWDDSKSMQHWKDMAWRMQDDSEKVLIARAKWLRETTGAKNLCIAGGVALNCVANGKIIREAGFENVWIQPAAGDDGIAIGCAYYGYLELLKNKRSFVMEHACLGREYSDDEMVAATRKVMTRMETKSRRSENVCKDVAQLLSKKKILGWFQGGSEFGPRALGNRSILADPRTPEMKDVLNLRVKHRQAFRPFAPIVLAERAAEIFVGEEESPFMLVAKEVHKPWRDKIPAITHVDGTARVQTVRKETNARLYNLLKEFEALTDVPVLLNTSFNIRGEPIVETPEDAVACFLSTGIDVLALGDLLLTKSAVHKIIAPFASAYAAAKSAVSAE